MEQKREDLDTARPEDDWGLPLEEQRALAEKRDLAKPKIEAAKARPLAAERAIPVAVANPMAMPAAPSVEPAAPARLPNRAKLDQFPAFATRSALFCATRHGAALPPNTPIKSQGTYDLRAAGERLSMRDKAVWEAAMQLAKECPDASQDIPVSLSDLAKRIGLREPNGAALASIWRSVERLAQAHVELTLQGKTYAGKLLQSATANGRARAIRVDLVLAMSVFEQDHQFKIDSARRHALSTSLAQWLHDFFSTHSSYRGKLTLGYLRDLCGFEGQVRRFPGLLDVAMAELAAKVPELVASHVIKRVGRSSDKWALEIQRGPETAVFSKPKANAAASAEPAPPKARQPQRWLAL